MDGALREHFDTPELNPRLQWHSEPMTWRVEYQRECLHIAPDANTDFWQRTHYGFQADNGHFLFASIRGDFIAHTQVAPLPVHQYDQAGLMVRVAPECWLKTSVEYEPGDASRLGVVVTNHGYSDWSTQDVMDVREIQFRIHRQGADYIVEASYNGRDWTQLRVAHLDHGPDATVQCGLYACSPKDAGFTALFKKLEITANV